MSRRETARQMVRFLGRIALWCVGGSLALSGINVAIELAVKFHAGEVLSMLAYVLGAMAVATLALEILALVVLLSSSREEPDKIRPGEDHMETVERLRRLGVTAGPSAIPPEGTTKGASSDHEQVTS